MARGLKCGGAWECLLCYRDSLCCCEGVKSLGPLKNVEADCALTLLWDYAQGWSSGQRNAEGTAGWQEAALLLQLPGSHRDQPKHQRKEQELLQRSEEKMKANSESAVTEAAIQAVSRQDVIKAIQHLVQTPESQLPEKKFNMISILKSIHFSFFLSFLFSLKLQEVYKKTLYVRISWFPRTFFYRSAMMKTQPDVLSAESLSRGQQWIFSLPLHKLSRAIWWVSRRVFKQRLWLTEGKKCHQCNQIHGSHCKTCLLQ